MRRLLSDHEVIAGEAPFRGKRVVDVGCGSGALVRWLAGQGAEVKGLDVAGMVARAESLPRAGEETYSLVFGARLPLEDGWADLVLYMASLHHVPEGEWGVALEEYRRVLRPSGRALILEPVQQEGAYCELARLAGEEAEAQRQAYRAIREAPGLALEGEEFFFFERSFADFRALVEHSEPEGRREEILARGRELTARRAREAGVAFDHFRYRSICRLNVLRKN